MRQMYAIFKRELGSFFVTPLAYVFIVIFLLAIGAFTFYLGQWYEAGEASLRGFFGFHPWLYLFLIPAISMRMWAEERKSGTMELLLTLPAPFWASVVGKYLAAWAFAAIALFLTFPIWITVNYLGEPDNGVIFASYIGSLLMAGGYLAIGSCMSAVTTNQVIAFVLSVVVCFLFTLSGLPLVLDFFAGWVPQAVLNTIASFSFVTHFDAIMDGVIDLRDLVYFASLIAVWLVATGIVIDLKRAG
ncbi:gliding motility protein GldF [Candidatus Phaeomarinobacter ectocarpi]|uniref:Gliding motility protein GldF n=1 Tax=Candidatus Phaeomarinibacter ectocarpi TaxID=1458461 RepID=X5MCU3_9HYPH|nr:ABC transporter permease subunit [Candidatus Phaeomarinobacter ectocarpi]CDO59547.1 gliding motility protein GldF [Candidatus Phaeomarinobacter ectocarpi]